ncbi:hypothetical protein PQX77_010460 [Marasmius sp. AFHP31]|nr:hypothetical protein PQX77_010460 [Marasmius sp. AFHP31]
MTSFRSSSMLPSFRVLATYAVLTFFVLFFVLSGFNSHLSGTLSHLTTGFANGFPDFSKYIDVETLTEHDFPLDDERKRVILVGDIHGRYDDLQRLLGKVSYDSSSDTLISVGDIIAKGPHTGSMQVLHFMASNNITAVRGNHDEKVIEWRTWINWIHSIPKGRQWLLQTTDKWIEYQNNRGRDESDVDEWVAKQMKQDRGNKKWWKKIPDGWQLFGDHYEIASAMSDEEYKYMVSRPLRIHAPSAHTFIVHAGVLASDPKRDPWDKRQPLATIPKVPHAVNNDVVLDKTGLLRRLQELAVLSKVPQNLDPWVTLNMRGVRKSGKVTRGKDGTPWADLYNEDMYRCKGFSEPVSKRKKNSLPCQPATVIYGHAASRGLDINRWTLGLDSGCVYKRRMTALVLGGKYASKNFSEDEESDEEGVFDIDGNRVKSVVHFGDDGKGKLYSVSCS